MADEDLITQFLSSNREELNAECKMDDEDLITQFLSSQWEELNGVNRSVSLHRHNGGDSEACLLWESTESLQETSGVSAASAPSDNLHSNAECQGVRNGVSSSVSEDKEYKVMPFCRSSPQNDLDKPSLSLAEYTNSDALFQRGIENPTVNSCSSSGLLQMDSICSFSPHGTPSHILPVVCGPTSMACIMPNPIPASARLDDFSGVGSTTVDVASTNSMQMIWPQSYLHGVSALGSALCTEETESFLLQEETSKEKGTVLGKSTPEEPTGHKKRSFPATNLDRLLAVPLTATAGTQHQQQNRGLGVPHLDNDIASKFRSKPCILTQPQTTTAVGALANEAGAAKPRVRARRGQATDPHSIAERIRRERIAERMKSLQELVPNYHKSDKASMLDEVIDYVKFLQTQVKVLSTSRLGGAEAIPSFIADLQSKGSGNQLSAATGQAGAVLNQEGQAFEKEVAELMESNMTAAMQYLQTKGLCLMPISLAPAVSNSTEKPLYQPEAKDS